MPDSPLSRLVLVEKTEKRVDSQATGLLLRSVREKLKIEQKTLAIEMGFSQSYIADLELGRRGMTRELFEKFRTSLKQLSEHMEGL